MRTIGLVWAGFAAGVVAALWWVAAELERDDDDEQAPGERV